MAAEYLENISSANWLSEALFTALDLDLFEILETYGMDGASADQLSQKLRTAAAALALSVPAGKSGAAFLL